MKPKHDNGRIDARYSVEREFTGAPRIQYVARFCGDWIGAAALQRDAWQMARDHAKHRAAEMTAPARKLPHSFRAGVKARPCFGVSPVHWTENAAIAACLIIAAAGAVFVK